MSTPIIRPVNPSDIPALVDLCEQHAHYERSEYQRSGKAEALHRDLFTDWPALHCIVAESNGQLLGYATYMRQYSTWDAAWYVYMDCLFLTEASRGMGIGVLLMNNIKQAARTMGCAIIQWQTPEFNTRAMKFYDRIGASSKAKQRYFWESAQ